MKAISSKSPQDSLAGALPRIVLALARKVRQEGGRALVVGGFARDRLLGIESKDVDVEVYGVPFEKLKAILESLGKVDLVGESFAVFKLADIDISIPRRDNKVGKGHKGFAVSVDAEMSFAAAASRRDFTINALAFDPLTGEVLDEHGGLSDLKKKVLRAVDPATFGEDPLRVLRAAQLAARFDFEIEAKTKKLCQKIDLKELSSARIGEEWKKLLLKSEKPSRGLELAVELKIIEKLHPELAALTATPQGEKWHPEGTVWEHTKLAVDFAAGIVRRDKLSEAEAQVLLFAALCHDMGKPLTTTVENGRIRSKGHDRLGADIAGKFLRNLNIPRQAIAKILPLIREHQFFRLPEFTDRAVRRLSVRLTPAAIQELVWLMEADLKARGEKSRELHEGEQILAKAKKLKVKVQPPRPLVSGADLIKMGYKEGPKLGKTLRGLYEAQLDGEFKSKAKGLIYLKRLR